MRLEINCAMCGREKDILIENTVRAAKRSFTSVIQNDDWIVQRNGENFDIYCSKKCAK